ncbi:NUDIX domain-containing protein [Streptomyces xiamenensis]
MASPNSHCDRALPRKRVAAGVLFFDDQDQVMLVDPIYKDPWDIPGGAVETDESPHPGPTAARASSSSTTAGTSPPSNSPPSNCNPTNSAATSSSPSTTQRTASSPLLTRRVHHSAHARAQNTTLYLEDGVPSR